ncbi:E3 ubiquitin-protein ligase MBR2 [Sesamum angolense]|uniref:RING-type E3 ubiquitin transferase n=1 Tax=Sesamum angolense TaxID=2727404 RepID=A0AAE1WM03_9LAMI|nr:E3 ubiquitin-protein ligase MBR2 [Sesamum angolense]
MSSDQEISAYGASSSPDDTSNNTSAILGRAYVTLTHEDFVDRLHQLDQRAEEMRSSIRRVNEMLTAVARLWNPHGRLCDATVSSYLETRSRPSCGDGEGALCVVCHDELHCPGDGMMIATLGCGHEYHVPCIKQWLLRKNACPLCRTLTVPL